MKKSLEQTDKKNSLDYHLKVMRKDDNYVNRLDDIGSALINLTKLDDMIEYIEAFLSYCQEKYSKKYKNPDVLVFDRLGWGMGSIEKKHTKRWYSLLPILPECHMISISGGYKLEEK